MAAASMSEASGQDTVIATGGISPDDSDSTKILSELNVLAIHGMIWLLHVNLFWIQPWRNFMNRKNSDVSSDLG